MIRASIGRFCVCNLAIRDMRKDNLSNELAGKLRQQILRGKWPVGAPLPSTRELAREHKVSANTVHGVLRELAAQGLVDLQPRRGRFVRSNGPGLAPRSRAALQIGVIRPVDADPPPEDENRWSYNIIWAMEDVFVTEGLRLALVGYPASEPNWPERLLEQVDARRNEFAGIVCFASPGMERVVNHLEARGIPWVSINRLDERRTENYVTADNVGAGRLVGSLFAGLGFDRVTLLGSRGPTHGSCFEKLTGLLQSYIIHGVPLSGIEVVECEDGDEHMAGQVMQRHLRERGSAHPQAIFCAGDFIAIGAMRACQEAGLSVPEDVSVVGSTGTQVGAYTQPALTTVAQPMTEMGRRAALMLYRMIRERSRQVPGERIGCRLILRSSLRPLPEALGMQVAE